MRNTPKTLPSFLVSIHPLPRESAHLQKKWTPHLKGGQQSLLLYVKGRTKSSQILHRFNSILRPGRGIKLTKMRGPYRESLHSPMRLVKVEKDQAQIFRYSRSKTSFDFQYLSLRLKKCLVILHSLGGGSIIVFSIFLKL